MQPSPTDRQNRAKTPTISMGWLAKLVALLALVNFLLGLFNLTYIPLRDFYIKHVPDLVIFYDPMKGIEPHRDTQTYLKTVDLLTEELTGDRSDSGSDKIELLFASLRQQTVKLIEENPFAVPSRLPSFAKIQREIEDRMNVDSAKVAFAQFWTRQHFNQAGSLQELQFFDRRIRPLMDANYFRNVDVYGQFIDEFWRVDIFFMAFFAVEFFTRTFFRYRRETDLKWFDAVLRRWYDIFLFVPFWRWLRVIPVLVRLQQTQLVDFRRALVQMTREPGAQLADRLAKFAMVRWIDQMQSAVATGELARALLSPQPYIAVNEVNEIQAIGDRLLELTIYKVLPRVQPEIEELLHYSIESALKDSDFYQTLQNIPGIGTLPEDTIETLANNLADTTIKVLANSYSDLEGRAIFETLSKQFGASLREELRAKATRAELESLLQDLLEELKLNYVVKSTETSPEAILDEVEQMDRMAENSSLPGAMTTPSTRRSRDRPSNSDDLDL
ncbi:hypothetical protein [Oxynema aestuarii]|uniref:Uncharacterized protein n=1 Tax=Oxynema aestuarii AP17 TaxID=2064643 RepID=A0A6H1U3H7_9CYAN|nr:hypothetical protein [Oxynema aestuarii]QIZ73422.1 hypothetical protein HCG48_24805 [Oxynema aestuarii AP17]RMH76387.1 MAG: hypothetical protein D6680_08660 [Cyanobacteria bacterium J007]